MLTQSRKAKGRALQHKVVEYILTTFPRIITIEDVHSTPMSSPGADVKLSPKARQVFDYSIECKNRENLKTLYAWYAQAMSHLKFAEPLLVVKMNNKKPLAVISLSHFFELQKELNVYRQQAKVEKDKNST